MARVEGSYESVVRGVSQQVPHQRFSGQHTDQKNLLSDPVEGLVRRRGTRRISEHLVTPSLTASAIAEIQKYRTHKWNPGSAGEPLQVAYKAKPGVIGDGRLLYIINQVTRNRVNTAGIDAETDTVYQKALANGLSAITSVGRYLFMAVNNHVGSVAASQDYLATTNRNKVVAWVRGGAYARTYTVTLLLDAGGQLKFSYTTMSSSYPTVINTAAAGNTTDTDYQNKLSKIVADYNSATTKWISDAAKDIDAENIANRLLNGPATSGNTGTGTGLIAANAAATGINKVTNLTYALVSSTLYIQGDNIREIVVDDGGDTTLIRGVGNEVTSADLVSTRHFYDKIVKVRAKKSDDSDAYYLKAESKNDSNDPGVTDRGEVVWKECAGYTQTLTNHFLFGYYHTDGVVYVSSSLSKLSTTLSITTPVLQPNLAGDDFTNPPPNFGTKQITYLGMFQDRLVVGSGAVASFSRPGDYLNFFRQSVLTLTDTDPIDMFALGAEDDVLRHSALFDKSLFIFGDKRQYVVNGRTVLTPTNQNMTVVSQFPNTTGAQPQGSGNFIFYTKPGDTSSPVITLNQMQYGQIADSTESYDLSQQLTDFCAGVCAEIVPVTSPAAVLVRPETSQNLYVFRYTDEVGTGRRMQAAWDRWEFDPAFGTIISMATYGDEILAMVMRRAEDGSTYLCVEQLSLRPAKSNEPYFDSYQVATGVGSGITVSSPYLLASPNLLNRCYVAVVGGSHALTGTTYEDRAELTASQIADGTLAAGIPFESSCIPTNPYQRDQNGNAILQGRLVLSQVQISMQDTGAMDVYVADANREWLSKHFNGFRLSRTASMVGSQPVVDTSITALIGREVRECRYRIQSVKFLPMVVTAISWQGQSFRR
ncbi:tail tubular protein B [Escherichia phage phiKT]|uniref:Tail tubular protein B n=1 Tax=Escherichia phage phiKT TaxID=1141519 RepID=H6VUB4_BPPKT|nr:tail protein [Escherichia phage phiKT]AEZ65102.1 tail tubular protein B [Escherichia phage phiKT]